MAMCGMFVVSMVLLFPLAFPCTLCTPKVQGLKNKEKYLALSFREVVALGTLVEFLYCTAVCAVYVDVIHHTVSASP